MISNFKRRNSMARTVGTDGVTPGMSSHFDAVLSELIVHSGHNLETCAESALEFRRILQLPLARGVRREAGSRGA